MRWGIAGQIVMAWVFTIPACFMLAWAIKQPARPRSVPEMTPRPREHIARLSPYEWEAMASDVAAAAGIAESEVVRFDTNTTAWPPVAWERTVARCAAAGRQRVPAPLERAAALGSGRDGWASQPDQVVVTSGADEALFLLASAYLGPGPHRGRARPEFFDVPRGQRVGRRRR